MNEQEPIFRLFFYKDLPERLNDRIVESIKMVKNTYDLDVNIVYIHASLEKITPKIDGILIKVDKYLPNQYHLIVGYEKGKKKMKTERGDSSSSGGIGFVGVLTIVFIVLKLLNVVDWSWLWVLSPIWISLCIALLLILIVVIIEFRKT